MVKDPDPILPDVEAFIARVGMSATAFGSSVNGDPRLVHDLRTGRELRRKTREKIAAFITAEALPQKDATQ
ncbi:hypothetical protein [Asaia lannensis]|uniref:hypothetical protein n=1 Tax=Asaia lannensis TaxID=415421 RepID=UPI003872E101